MPRNLTFILFLIAQQLDTGIIVGPPKKSWLNSDLGRLGTIIRTAH
jgi:hypothetical protein